MLFNGYNHALSVFIPESGLSEKANMDRNYITKKLKVIED
jgi:hypothetical protein